MSVIHFLNHKKQVEQPVLVLAGLHQSGRPGHEYHSLGSVLRNCEILLASARSARLPVAFVRRVAPVQSISEPQDYPAWLKGFEPTRNDMVFDVTKVSCYSNIEFAQAMEYSNGHFAIAGLLGETTCLATGIDAYHRHHRFTYLSDASACQNNGAIPASMFHEAVSQVMSIYGVVMESAQWGRSLMQHRSAW
ncbi:MAG: isochorismatase family protein [Rhizomicrobium sp.]